MPTLSDLVEHVISTVQGDALDTEQSSTLLDPVPAETSGPLSFRADSVLGAGLVEVDDELMYVARVDPQSGMVEVPPWGRGQRGSSVAAHEPGARVTRSPRLARVAVRREVADAIAGLYPELWAVRVDASNLVDVNRVAYPAPADCRRIIEIKWRESPTPRRWFPVRSWRLDTRADTAQFPTGASVEIGDCMEPGMPIRITYEAEPAPLVNATDDYAAVTGLPEGSADIPVLLATAQLISRADLSKAQGTTVEQSQRSQLVPPGVYVNASKYYMAQAQQRIAEERDRLLRRYPARIVRLI